LKDLLEDPKHEGWDKLLEESIRDANVCCVKSLPDYYEYLNKAVTLIPTDRDLYQKICEFYWLLDQPSGRELQKHKAFTNWMVKFADDWGSFLDTPESAEALDTFKEDPAFHMDDYVEFPSGWLTFNQFFARQVKPGKRPITRLCDDSVIVSPADSTFVGQWPISENSKITTKNMTWSVLELLDGSPYQCQFAGGMFMHSFLNVNDYHRFHVPVRGIIRESRVIHGKVYLDVERNPDRTYKANDGTGYQFSQARGLIVIESPIGLVAVLPIGMAQVSSVVLTAKKGVKLAKGDEFGYFLFGGSDIIILFSQDCNVEITAAPGIHYNQGTWIGDAI
jgi:phosphatidylserine decarboxylase precursor